MTSSIAFTRHDHRHCKRRTLAAVGELCTQRSLRLTPVRRRTLEILLESHEALGAYEVLDKLASSGFGEKPPVVYRALAFLLEQGFAHKLEQRNAYVACADPQTQHEPCFMICQCCGRVAEQVLEKTPTQLAQVARSLGFKPAASIIEMTGTCSTCPAIDDTAARS